MQLLLAQEGIQLGHATIERILKRRGLIEGKSRQLPATQRCANDLWQLDFGESIGCRQAVGAIRSSLIDDHSRYLVALEPLASTRLSGVEAVLVSSLPALHGGDAHGSRCAAVEYGQRPRPYSAVRGIARTGHPTHLQRARSSTDAGQGGTVPSHAGRSSRASWLPNHDGGLSGSPCRRFARTTTMTGHESHHTCRRRGIIPALDPTA